MCRGVWVLSVKHVAKADAKLLTVQILVVVAIIQTWILKADMGGAPCEQ